MSDSKHTHGPWGALTDADDIRTYILKTGNTTELLFYLPGKDKHDPNVRLITAAPELLKALEKAVADYGPTVLEAAIKSYNKLDEAQRAEFWELIK